MSAQKSEQVATTIDRLVYDARQCLRARETGPTGAADFARDAAKHLETLLEYVDQIEDDAGHPLSTVLGWLEVKRNRAAHRRPGMSCLDAIDADLNVSDT